MRAFAPFLLVVACLMPVRQAGAWQQDLERTRPAKPDLSAMGPVDRDAIKQAIRDTIAERKQEEDKADRLSTEANGQFGKKFDDAKVPSCLGPDGLKNQPSGIFSGIFALPFLAVAIIRGKCN